MKFKFYLPIRHFIKIYVSLAFFFIILVIGTVGFMVIEGYTFVEAFYMTVITLATVGFTEVHPLSNAGRIFTSILILANIGTFTYFLTQLSNYFLDGEFTRAYKLFNMKNAISELDGHIILCGFGRNGVEAGRILNNNGKNFVVIEKVETNKDSLPFKVPYILEADATHDETLLEAGIMKASALKLVRVEIDQLNQEVSVAWIAPKVLSSERIDVMLNKFQEWEAGVKDVETYIQENWKIKA